MKDMGMEKIIFDKYNTLIRHGEVNFPEPSFKDSYAQGSLIISPS